MRMRKHPKNPKTNSIRSTTRKRRVKPVVSRGNCITPNLAPSDHADFLSLFLQRINWQELGALNQRKHGAGRPTYRLTRAELLVALVFHYTVSCAGTFSEHLFCCFGVQMAESTLSERRQALPFEVFAELLRRVLRPIAEAGSAAFFRQWRLVALDGVNFSLPNTPQVKRRCRKGGNQNGRAAFAKLQCAALVELALHNPLAALVGRAGESEWKLSLGLLQHLPERCLLLGDRLYGCGAFLVAAQKRLQACQGHFLVRVKESLKVVRSCQRLPDGSQLVEIKALEPGDTHRVAATMQVREVRATLQRRGHRPVRIRLWTSLSWEEASAVELVRLYASRWEQELYFRELKWQLGVNDLLRSQTPETAAQEVAAMIVGSSLIAHERAKLQPGEGLQHRVSFIKTWQTLEPLWLTLLLGADLLSDAQKQALCERFYGLAARRLMQKKRSRSCPRAMRQPFQPWPRKRKQRSVKGPLHLVVNLNS
jgi:DDE family transposase